MIIHWAIPIIIIWRVIYSTTIFVMHAYSITRDLTMSCIGRCKRTAPAKMEPHQVASEPTIVPTVVTIEAPQEPEKIGLCHAFEVEKMVVEAIAAEHGKMRTVFSEMKTEHAKMMSEHEKMRVENVKMRTENEKMRREWIRIKGAVQEHRNELKGIREGSYSNSFIWRLTSISDLFKERTTVPDARYVGLHVNSMAFYSAR